MKLMVTAILLFTVLKSPAQLEITTGAAINKNDADGIALNMAYDFRITDRWYTKTKIGYKYLHKFNDYVGATLKVSISEIHQTLSYEIIQKKKYIFNFYSI